MDLNQAGTKLRLWLCWVSRSIVSGTLHCIRLLDLEPDKELSDRISLATCLGLHRTTSGWLHNCRNVTSSSIDRAKAHCGMRTDTKQFPDWLSEKISTRTMSDIH